jgi:hypothetical protein
MGRSNLVSPADRLKNPARNPVVLKNKGGLSSAAELPPSVIEPEDEACSLRLVKLDLPAELVLSEHSDETQAE